MRKCLKCRGLKNRYPSLPGEWQVAAIKGKVEYHVVVLGNARRRINGDMQLFKAATACGLQFEQELPA